MNPVTPNRWENMLLALMVVVAAAAFLALLIAFGGAAAQMEHASETATASVPLAPSTSATTGRAPQVPTDSPMFQVMP